MERNRRTRDEALGRRKTDPRASRPISERAASCTAAGVSERAARRKPAGVSERAARRKPAGWDIKHGRRRWRVKHRRAHAAPLAKPIAQLTSRDRNRVSFLLPHALRRRWLADPARTFIERQSSRAPLCAHPTSFVGGSADHWYRTTTPYRYPFLSGGISGRG